jgi:transcriptional regulator with XRE-family HTH domain
MPREASEMTGFGRRVMAARVLAGLSQAQLAAALNISEKTLQRLLAGKREIKDVEMAALPAVLGVPEWFLRRGFGGAPDGQQHAREREDAEARRHDEVMRRLDAMAEQLRVLATQARDRDRTE